MRFIYDGVDDASGMYKLLVCDDDGNVIGYDLCPHQPPVRVAVGDELPNGFPTRRTMFTAMFWKAAAERAIKTVAQTAVAIIGVDAVSIIALDWQYIAGVSATAGVLSILSSVASNKVGAPGPSLGREIEGQ
jgi:hypothetical protein